MHTTIVAFDISGFGKAGRTAQIQLQLRGELYQVLEEAFTMTSIGWRDCYVEDRGDGVMVIAPPDVRTELFLDPLAHHLTAVLRRDNRPANEVGRIRLRQAVHAGMVLLDPHGVAGHALVHTFRLLEAAAFKRAAAKANTDLALIVSDQTYTDATAYGGLVNPSAYQALRINCKETRSRAWTWFPAQANWAEPARGQPVGPKRPAGIPLVD